MHILTLILTSILIALLAIDGSWLLEDTGGGGVEPVDACCKWGGGLLVLVLITLLLLAVLLTAPIGLVSTKDCWGAG